MADAAALVYEIDSSSARTAATDLAKLQDATARMAKSFADGDKAIRRSNGQFASSAEVVSRYGREVQQLAAKYNPALDAVYRYQQAEAELNRAVGLGVVTKKQAAVELEKVRKGLDSVGSTANRVTGILGRFGAQFVAFGAATFGIRSVASTLSGFEKSMSSVAAVTRAATADMGAMRDMAKQLGATTEFTASQAAEGLRFLGMAGFSTKDSLAAIPAVLDLATAAAMDLGAAADISSNIMSAFGIAAENAADVADVLAAAASSANTDVTQMGDGMKYVGPVAASLGVSVNDAAAAIGALSNAGIQGSMAGTGLRRVLSSLSNPTAKADKAIRAMGLSIEDLNPVSNDLVDIVDRLADAGLTAADALTIFGDRGGPAILALTENNADLRELTENISDVRGEAGRMANEMRDNLSGDFDTLKAAAEGLIIAIGEAGLTSALRGLTQGLAALVSGASNIINLVGRITGSFEGLGTAALVVSATRIPALTTALRGVGLGASSMAAQFTASAVASRAMTAAMTAQAVAANTLGRAMMFAGGPVGILVGGIAALATHLYKTRGRVTDLSNEFVALQGKVNDTVTALAMYRESQNLTTAQQALAAVNNELEHVQESLVAAAKTAETLNTGLDYAERYGTATDKMRKQAADALADAQKLSDRNQILIAQQGWLSDKVEIHTQKLSEAATQAGILSDEQEKALDDASQMLTELSRSIELRRAEVKYGRESAVYQATILKHERDIYFAKVNALDVTEDIKDQLRDTWMELQRGEGKTREWDHAMNILKDTSADVLDILKDIATTEPGAGWLDTAISKARQLGDALWDGLASMGEGAPGLSSSARPGRRPFELGVPDPKKKGAGGGKGRSGGKSAADQLQDEMKRRWDVLNEGFQSEYALAMQSYQQDLKTLEWALDQKLIAEKQYQDAINMLRVTAWGSEWEQTTLQYNMDQEALQSALDQKLISHEDYYRRLRELQFQNLISEHNRSDMAQDLSNTAQYFGQLTALTGNSYNTLERLQKSFAASAALVNAYLAASQTLADPTLGFWAKMAAYGKVLAAGLGLVGAIKGGGKSGGGSSAAAATQQAQREPTRYVTINWDGPDWMRDGINGLLDEIYEQSKDGRVIIAQERR